MIISHIRHYLVRFSLIAAVLSITGFFIFSDTASAQAVHANPSQTHAHQLADPTGATWNLTVTFVNGGRVGQTESQTITFASNSTLSTVVNGISGTGSWWPTGAYTFGYTIHEALSTDSPPPYVTVWQSALLVDGTHYNSGGEGLVTPPGSSVPPQPITSQSYNDTYTIATR
jgi:hypothetical protein